MDTSDRIFIMVSYSYDISYSIKECLRKLEAECTFFVYEVMDVVEYFKKSYTSTVELASLITRQKEKSYFLESMYETKMDYGQISLSSCFWSKNECSRKKKLLSKISISEIIGIVREYIRQLSDIKKYNQNNIYYLNKVIKYTYFALLRLRFDNSLNRICA